LKRSLPSPLVIVTKREKAVEIASNDGQRGGNTMTAEKRDFNGAAASWDEKPARLKLAGDVTEAIIRQVAPHRGMRLADFGCGTGLISFKLQPLVAAITGIDSSPGMLDIFKAKITAGNFANVQSKLFDIDQGDELSGEYDLIVSSMTLHHIRQHEALLRQLYTVLVPGGILAIADLDPDGGLFHDDNTGVFHFGFERAAVRAMFGEAGFNDIRDSQASELVKEAPDGSKRTFTVFLVSGRKN
jgi:2-polyprenyl-3-methyl-5-hydroxy-6-metoxy-1,4-benzoquinol methylase